MSYRYERIGTGTDSNSLLRLLNTVERLQHNGPLWLAIKCYDREVGPPICGGKGTRWFEPKVSPDQMWLPFPRFEPVELLHVYTNYQPEMGEGYILGYRTKMGRNVDIQFHENQCERPGGIIALAAYHRKETLSHPFGQSAQPCEIAPERSQALNRLSDLLHNLHVRRVLEEHASQQAGHSLRLDPESATFRALETGRVEALIHSHHYDVVTQRYVFDLDFRDTINRYRVLILERDILLGV